MASKDGKRPRIRFTLFHLEVDGPMTIIISAGSIGLLSALLLVLKKILFP